MQDGSNDIEPLLDFVSDVTIMTIPIQGLHSFGFEFWVTFVKSLGPILAWRLHIVVGSRDLGVGGSLTSNGLSQQAKGLDGDWVAIAGGS